MFLSTKTVMTVVLACSLLTIVSCGNRQGDINEEKQGKILKASPEPPATDIHTATIMGDVETLRKHIEAGSDLNIKEAAGGSTPLITAVVFGRDEAARLLVDGGADLNSTNNEGSTALYCAAFFGRTELLQLLLESGADKNIRNNYGTTALESVLMPFGDIKGIYDQINSDLGPLGFKLDYKTLEEARPAIAEMLR